MKIDVELAQGQQLTAQFNGHTIISDQSINVGGNEQYPEPFDYFLASMALCATFYMRKFCQQRNINTEGLKVSQQCQAIDDSDPYKKKISLSVTLPDNFPAKYQKAILAAANSCTVKKVIQAMPEFEVALAEQ